ncbi:hypothetical protein LJC07_06860 [Christensenellaceae bacterium OttesenSCG-928-L17]|nr:hypothetical protein [Christensenellaceae bacterium OttesenSCG-928-L17]
MNELFTWSMLATYAGATLFTALVTQLFKNTGVLARVPTRLFSCVVALMVLLAAHAFTTGLTLSVAALCAVNAVVVSLASNGAFDAAVYWKEKNE